LILWPFLTALALHTTAGVSALLWGHKKQTALLLGTTGCVVASIIGTAGSVHLIFTGGIEEVEIPWPLPIGVLRIGIDPLSAFFLLCIYLVSGLSALYSDDSLREEGRDACLSPPMFFFNLLAAAMSAVVLARDGVFFIIAWEIMSLSLFFLITFDHAYETTRRAGWSFLIASQVGIVSLLILFGLLAGKESDFRFASWIGARNLSPDLLTPCFLLALIGFGTKAGVWFLHSWIPKAHAAAPSHLSATLSAVITPMGLYGLLRMFTFLGSPHTGWGLTLITLGLISGLLGMLHALGQHNLKQMLAYSGIAHVGIILIGIGLGVLGQSTQNNAMAFLGFGGALLHLLNHSLYQGLLFHGAGSVLIATGTEKINALGGLFKKMPITSGTFLIGSMAISGLPPLNGFVSQWLLYVAAFRGGITSQGMVAVVPFIVIPSLALIGALTVACFIRGYGIAFLGESRSNACDTAEEPPMAMRIPMLVGAGLCVAIGVWPEGAFRFVERPAQFMMGTAPFVNPMLGLIAPITPLVIIVIGLSLLLVRVRFLLLRQQETPEAPTWGGGADSITPRAQYTASSFEAPVMTAFQGLLSFPVKEKPVKGIFPTWAHYQVIPKERTGWSILEPARNWILTKRNSLQVVHRSAQWSLLWMLVTVIVLLVWQLSGETP
jgi:hydrogenase-4 component B